MHHFRTGQRVIVTNPHHQLVGRVGKVLSLNVSDAGALVEIRGGLPDDQSIILDGMAYHDRTILHPSDCEPAR